MKNVLLIALSLLLIMVSAVGDTSAQITVDEAIQQAESAYNAGDYRTAATLYQDLVNNQFVSFEIYYNLGSAYYELGLLGDALVNYRRAQLINPRHGQLNMMIVRIRSERVDFQGDEAALLDALATTSETSFRLSEIGWTVLVLWSGWFVMLTLWVLRAKWRNQLLYPLVIVGALLLVGLSLLLPRLYVMEQRPGAVVIELTAPVMSGPGEGYLEIMQLFSAAEMRILDEEGDWIKFILPDGRRGWIARDDIAAV